MKRILSIITILLIALLIIPCSLYAQEDEVYVSLNGGISIPMSDYASTDFEDESSGFAQTGGNFAINFGYRFNEYFSLSGLLNGSVNRYDYIALQDWFTQVFAETLPNTSWAVQTKNWGLGGLLAGITGSLPLSPNKLFLDGRLLGGFTYVYSPALDIRGIESGEDDIRVYIDQYSTVSWALDVGAGFRYHRSRSQYFTLYADYFIAHPYYTGVHVQEDDLGLNRETSFSQKIYAINISLGLGYIID